MCEFGFSPGEGVNIAIRAESLTGEIGGNEAADEDEEGSGGGDGGDVDDKFPGGVELVGFGKGVDEDVCCGGVGRMVDVGPGEEGEGDFGVGFETEEGLLEEMGGERDSSELERRFGGMEGVMVVEEYGGEEVGVGGGLEGGEERQRPFVGIRIRSGREGEEESGRGKQ